MIQEESERKEEEEKESERNEEEEGRLTQEESERNEEEGEGRLIQEESERKEEEEGRLIQEESERKEEEREERASMKKNKRNRNKDNAPPTRSSKRRGAGIRVPCYDPIVNGKRYPEYTSNTNTNQDYPHAVLVEGQCEYQQFLPTSSTPTHKFVASGFTKVDHDSCRIYFVDNPEHTRKRFSKVYIEINNESQETHVKCSSRDKEKLSRFMGINSHAWQPIEWVVRRRRTCKKKCPFCRSVVDTHNNGDFSCEIECCICNVSSNTSNFLTFNCDDRHNVCKGCVARLQ